MKSIVLIFITVILIVDTNKIEIKDNIALDEHAMVTDNNMFPYVAAILKKTQYMCAGALIDDLWVITSADSLFFLRETTRVLRVRLGSSNNRKGGSLIPVKYFEIHPYFDDKKPNYDVALIMLARPVQLRSSLNPIRLQRLPREISATHFIVTAWSSFQSQVVGEPVNIESMEIINRRRMLTVTHLHPTNHDNCSDHLDAMDIDNTGTLMCLDPALESDACSRDPGAPVVLNGILWGVMSSWTPEDCEETSPSLVTLVSAPNVSSWIHATTHGHRWNKKQINIDVDDDYENDYYDIN